MTIIITKTTMMGVILQIEVGGGTRITVAHPRDDNEPSMLPPENNTNGVHW